jgi:hypothetical protein
MDERFALGAVGNDKFYLRFRFHAGRESSAAGADHTEFPQFLAKHSGNQMVRCRARPINSQA